jgi:hypothetical protein
MVDFRVKANLVLLGSIPITRSSLRPPLEITLPEAKINLSKVVAI